MTTDTGYLVAIGAFAGGVNAILKLILEMPRDFPGPIVVALHSHCLRAGTLHDCPYAKQSIFPSADWSCLNGSLKDGFSQ